MDPQDTRLVTRRVALTELTAALALGGVAASRASEGLPATTRKIVLEKVEGGYRWKLIEAPVPAVGSHQVLVRVRAVSLNHPDLDILEPGYSSRNRDPAGMVAGIDAAGDVLAVGPNVSGIRRGQRVTNTFFTHWSDGPFSQTYLSGAFGWTIDGVFSEYIILPDTAVVPIPDGLSYEEAATLPTSGVTAWSAVTKGRSLTRGDVVLVQGTGGVSTFALQFAAGMGAHVVATSSSDDKLQRARTLGASDGINYRSTPQWADRVRELTHSHGADLVVDIGGKATLGQSLQSLADAGTVAVVGGLTGYDGAISAYDLLIKGARAEGIFAGSRADALHMGAFIAAHRLKPVIDRVFPFEQHQEALSYFKAGQFVGKVVLKLQ
jgi:NADPH:quinone reductase-like Zn-dependent oxidoreductase